MVPTGRNKFFILEPGFRVVLAGENERLVITVLDETLEVNGVTTRVVEEKKSKYGQLADVSRNFYAIDRNTKDIFYFGEEVAVYESGKVVSDDGTWLAGTNGAKAGLIMPGTPKVGMKYFQQIAPGVAMDRAEIVDLTGTLETTAGSISSLLTTREESDLDGGQQAIKVYASGIGLVRQERLKTSRDASFAVDHPGQAGAYSTG